ncbi:MAG: YfhO family protein [Ignavibacteria bacterium]|nr:YfhO family protein [Ignavibacteria bacterium]
MAKSKTPVRRTSKKTKQGFLQNENLGLLSSENYKSWLLMIGIIIFALLLFFNKGIFGGKIFSSPDNMSPLSSAPFLQKATSDIIYPLWTPYVFSGMPSYGSLMAGLPRDLSSPIITHNALSIHKFLTTPFDSWISILNPMINGNMFFMTIPFYFIFGISLFFYIRYKFKNNLIAIFAGLTGVFATGIIQLIIVGHHTKMFVFSFFPLALLFIDKLIEEEGNNNFKRLIYFALLTIVLQLQINFNHVQMLFYSFMFIGIYLLFVFIYKLVKKLNLKKIIVSYILIIIALGFSFLMNLDPILSVMEYKNYSMRGQSSIEATSDPLKSDEKPLSYEYATNWSFSPGEVMTFIIPYYYGFGNVEVNGERNNLYWGQMPFTDSPVYFGVITFVLAIIGIVMNFRRNAFVMSLTFIVFLFLLLSFGRTFPLLYNFFYNNVPYFSSFRAPVMIHYYLDLAFTILACFGLKSVIDTVKDTGRQKLLKYTSYAIAGFGIIMLFGAIAGCENSYTNSVATGPIKEKLLSQGATPQQISQYAKQLASLAYKNVIQDMLLHSILILITISIVILMLKKTIGKYWGLIFIIIIATFDIVNISSKTLHWDDKDAQSSYFKETDYTKWILNREPDTYQFRIAEMNNGRLTTSNLLAYFNLHLFNGYHGAKLRIYQDAIDVAGGENPFLLGLANVKYILNNKPIIDTNSYTEVYKGSMLIYENKFFMPRAYFVDELQVQKGLVILKNIKTTSFNPRQVAYIEEELKQQISKPDSTVEAKLIKGNIHKLEYEVNASGNNFLVITETYYRAGWKAYIDGNETEIYKTNYLFRGIVVPPGKHKVEMIFHSDIYETGKNISLISNIFISFVLIAGIVGYYIKRNKSSIQDEK